MTIRRCDTRDLDAVYEIEAASFAGPLSKRLFSDMLSGGTFFYALEDGGAMRAYVCFDRVLDEGQIISVACAPESRRCGYARFLLRSVAKDAPRLGIDVFTLEVREDNLPARALYEMCGFKEVGRRKNYYSEPDCDAILMDLHIGRPATST